MWPVEGWMEFSLPTLSHDSEIAAAVVSQLQGCVKPPSTVGRSQQLQPSCCRDPWGSPEAESLVSWSRLAPRGAYFWFRGSPGSGSSCTSNREQRDLMYIYTTVPPAMYLCHGRRCDCMDHALDPIMPLPACVEGPSHNPISIFIMSPVLSCT